MSNDRGTIVLKAGETIVVTGPKPLSFHGDAKQATRVRVTAPGTYVEPVPVPPVVVPPAVPHGAMVVTPQDDIRALLAAGTRYFVLRTGVHRFALGSSETQYKDVSILPYPGDAPIIDGTGLDPHLVYLGPASGTWTLGVSFRGFRPVDSGVIGIGDGCRLVTVKGFGGVGMGRAGTPYDINSHGVYFHGTGTGLIEDADLRGFPGAAIHAYRGAPVVTVNRGFLGAFYESALIYSGVFTFTGTAFVEPAAAWDIQVSGDATGAGKATLTGCMGTGTGGAVRRTG